MRAENRFADEESLIHHLKHNRVGSARPSAKMRKKFKISSKTLSGFAVYTVAPRSGRTSGDVIYLHGGAYVEGILRWHWKFIARMVERLGMTFTVPMYPLAPEHDCATTSAFVLAVYRHLSTGSGASRLVIMGDSSGGGLATSLAMQANIASLPKPTALVLISPWLDVTMSHPTQAEIERFDPLLRRPGPRAAGRWYAGSMSTTDPRVSPIYGDIASLPPILMFCGTHDILVSDARRLAARAEAEGADIEYHEKAGLMHGYPLLFFPESRNARERIVQYVRAIVGQSHAPKAPRIMRSSTRPIAGANAALPSGIGA
jgi:acetyl esterase/lipase